MAKHFFFFFSGEAFAGGVFSSSQICSDYVRTFVPPSQTADKRCCVRHFPLSTFLINPTVSCDKSHDSASLPFLFTLVYKKEHEKLLCARAKPPQEGFSNKYHLLDTDVNEVQRLGEAVSLPNNGVF